MRLVEDVSSITWPGTLSLRVVLPISLRSELGPSLLVVLVLVQETSRVETGQSDSKGRSTPEGASGGYSRSVRPTKDGDPVVCPQKRPSWVLAYSGRKEERKRRPQPETYVLALVVPTFSETDPRSIKCTVHVFTLSYLRGRPLAPRQLVSSPFGDVFYTCGLHVRRRICITNVYSFWISVTIVTRFTMKRF